MKQKATIKRLAIILPLVFGMLFAPITSLAAQAAELDYDYNVDLANLTYTTKDDDTAVEITTYTQSDYANFETAYANNTLPAVYVTEFLFDGVGMYKPYDLDDFIKNGADYAPDALEIKTLNINTSGKVALAGNYTGMIAVNSNTLDDDLTIILNGVLLDTDSKKVPAVYIYNKDITYTDHKVTINLAAGSQNSLIGGKFKKVSLAPSEDYETNASKYSASKTYCYEVDNACTYYSPSELYAAYPNYYKVYTAEEVEKVLFASVTADQEDLRDGDPVSFYKGAGAISSDIDLYFTGSGELTVSSKSKEGIETKGNLTLGDGSGVYNIYASDDALNTTTSSSAGSNIHNTLTIDVESLLAEVSPDADEGDAIDSNGQLIINGGLIIAIAHPTSQDDGLDSETGTIINGGTIVATGNMSDQISNNSSQGFVKVNFSSQQPAGTLVVVAKSDGTPIAGFQSARTFTTFTYSSDRITAGETYSIYTGGEIDASEAILTTDDYNFYVVATSYAGGTLAQTVTANANSDGRPDGRPDDQPDGRPDRPDDPSRPDRPSDNPAPENPDNTDGDTYEIDDPTDIPVPNTSDTSDAGTDTIIYTTDTTTVAVPNTGHQEYQDKQSSGAKTSSFVWLVSGFSAVALVAYVAIDHKRHAVRFHK